MFNSMKRKYCQDQQTTLSKYRFFFFFYSFFQGGVLVFSEKSKVEYLREVNTLLFLFLTLK